MGKKIATGGFGTVYKADLEDGETPGGRPVIVKKVSCCSFVQSNLHAQALLLVLRHLPGRQDCCCAGVRQGLSDADLATSYTHCTYTHCTYKPDCHPQLCCAVGSGCSGSALQP